MDGQRRQHPAWLNATIVVAVASGTLYFLGSINDASFLRSLGVPGSSFMPSPEELLRLGATSILGLIIDWWLPAVVVGGAAALHAIALAIDLGYANFWRQGVKIPPALTAAVIAVPIFVLATNQALLDGARRASGPVVQRLQPSEFVIKGSNEVVTGRVVRCTGAFFVIMTVDGRTVILNAADVKTARSIQPHSRRFA